MLACAAGRASKERRRSLRYLLAESMTNAAAASQLNCLALLGLDAQKLDKLRGSLSLYIYIYMLLCSKMGCFFAI